MHRSRLFRSLAIASAVCAARLANAQPAPVADATPVVTAAPEVTPQVAIDQARQAFERGVMFARQERWSAARDEFLISRSRADRPRTAFNAALACERLGRFLEARRALEDCIGMRGVTTESDLVSDAQSLLAQVRASLSTLTLAVAPAAADVRIDGRLIEGSSSLRTIEIDPGLHVLDVSATGTTAQSSEFSTRPGERVSRRVDLAVAPARIAVAVNRSEALVSIDDEPVGHGSIAWQGPPGDHRVRVEADGYTTFRSAVQADPGGNLRVEVALSRSGRSFWASPVLWSVVGGVTIAAVLSAVLIRIPVDPNSGSARTIVQGITVTW